MVILLEEASKMGAERFLIEDRLTIAKNLIKKAEKLWQKDQP